MFEAFTVLFCGHVYHKGCIKKYFFFHGKTTALPIIASQREEHEVQKKVNDEIRGQLPKEVIKSAIRKKTEGGGKLYNLFFY